MINGQFPRTFGEVMCWYFNALLLLLFSNLWLIYIIITHNIRTHDIAVICKYLFLAPQNSMKNKEGIINQFWAYYIYCPQLPWKYCTVSYVETFWVVTAVYNIKQSSLLYNLQYSIIVCLKLCLTITCYSFYYKKYIWFYFNKSEDSVLGLIDITINSVLYLSFSWVDVQGISYWLLSLSIQSFICHCVF